MPLPNPVSAATMNPARLALAYTYHSLEQNIQDSATLESYPNGIRVGHDFVNQFSHRIPAYLNTPKMRSQPAILAYSEAVRHKRDQLVLEMAQIVDPRLKTLNVSTGPLGVSLYGDVGLKELIPIP